LNLAPLVEDVPGQPMRLIGIYSRNRMEWMLVDLACCMYGFVTVPLYDTLGP
jgi:long-chain acyl-CoA synthetase